MTLLNSWKMKIYIHIKTRSTNNHLSTSASFVLARMETTQVALSKGVNEHVVECHSVDWWVVQDAMNFGYRKEKKAASTSQPLTKENILYILLWSNSGKGELIYDINRRWTLGKLFYGCDKYHAQKNIYLVIRFQRGKCPSQLRGMTAGRHSDWCSNLEAYMFNSKHKVGTAYGG